MLMDKITEAIAHFIGLFEITLEEARLREAFEEFKARQMLDPEQPQLLNVDVNGKAPHDFIGFDPRIPYKPLDPELVWAKPWTHVMFRPPDVLDIPLDVIYPGFLLPISPGGAAGRLLPEIEPPGSVAAYILQKIRLADNDYVDAAGPGVLFTPEMDHGAQMAALFGAAMELAPFGDENPPGSSEEIAAFIVAAADTLRAFPEESEAGADVFVSKASTIDGNFVNGEVVDQLPLLEDYRPPKEKNAVPDDGGIESFDYGGKTGGTVPSGPVSSASGAVADGEGNMSIKASVELTAGDNTLVNSAFLTSNWLASPVFAVLGSHFEINAVIQINAWCDTDLVGPSMAGWARAADLTQAFNLALFDRMDPSADSDSSAASGGFPQYWAVTEIEGDLVIMNWIEQFSFMMDHDVAILSSSGVKTTVISGANMAMNEIFLEELGFYYDLIIVGGSIYDANLIQQMNILLDNDLVGAVNGFETSGQGSASTSGNLLWNQAAIVNVGAAGRFDALPAHYRKAADNLAGGNKALTDEVLNDGAFVGLAGIRVLYISGDILNLQYVRQTNVLGDNDQVAMAMNGLASDADADWTISTGANALINLAGIVDVDATGKTYVGGGVYSDEVLIQAELVSTAPELGGQNPDVLVNEAIAFLGDDMAGPDSGLHSSNPGVVAPDAAYADPMQTILA